MLKKAIIATGISAAAAGCGDGGGGGQAVPPAAELVSESPVEQDQYSLQDASASFPGSADIIRYEFDRDNDGIPEIVETPDSNDGAFDGIAAMPFPEPGDYQTAVAVVDANSLSDTALSYVGVGFGDDSAGAYSRIQQALEGIGYICAQDRDFQLFNPSTGKMVAYTGLKAEMSDFVLYAVYDWTALTQEQRDTLDARAAEGLEPETAVIRRHDSPAAIDTIMEGM